MEDAPAILDMYRVVASAPSSGLARGPEEITLEYVTDFLKRSTTHGVALVACEEGSGRITGEIHCYSRGLTAFAHVLGDLTVAVHPDAQRRGIARALFERLLQIVSTEWPKVLRVELMARESNSHALGLYESLGFKREGKMIGRVRNRYGGLEADIPMAWQKEDSDIRSRISDV